MSPRQKPRISATRGRASARRLFDPDRIAQHPLVAAPRAVKAIARRIRNKYLLNARPDTVDFRDMMYVPSLVDVPRARPLESYLALGVPVLDQGQEGACTGYGLATVVHYLLRTRRPVGDRRARASELKLDRVPVSPEMLYCMARRYDEWAGEHYEGSSARGAMKGWHKHGICAKDKWIKDKRRQSSTSLTHEAADDARLRPLGGYFRVNHQDLVAMHAAITEAGILYATSWVHNGWDKVTKNGQIKFVKGNAGGHAFAIVGYDATGFWIQNSWGTSWGRAGFGHVSYEDWLTNGTDIWVARLGAPIAATWATGEGDDVAGLMAAGGKSPLLTADLRPHVISLGNDGLLRSTGVIGTDIHAVDELFRSDFPRITANWKKKRLLLYAHGGLTSEEAALQRISEYRQALIEAEVYPIGFVWKSDYWSTLTDALQDALSKRRTEGILDSSRDFVLNRLDDALEPIARIGTGKLEWDQMKQNALSATASADGGARIVAHYAAELAKLGVEIHVVGHSAGSILMAPFVRLLTANGQVSGPSLSGVAGLGTPIKTCTMWAPACTVDLFNECYAPAIDAGTLSQFALFTLTDKVEQDDNCAGVYHKSLLYLVSHAFEKTLRNPLIPVIGTSGLPAAGEPILGMEWWITRTPALARRFQVTTDTAGPPSRERHCVWIKSPSSVDEGSRNASASLHHGDFDDDAATVKATLARILGLQTVARSAHVEFTHSRSGNAALRQAIAREG